jgi:hypothetical protein
MVFGVLEKIYQRVHYEADRARRLWPTAVRFVISQIEDRLHVLHHRLDHWRGACDHTIGTGRKNKKLQRVRPVSRRKTTK